MHMLGSRVSIGSGTKTVLYILFLPKRPVTQSASLVSGLRMFMGGGNHLLLGGSHFENAIKTYRKLCDR
ncbi:hypothetical protein EVAR_23611_1 [Eumeta japonica]|uniref:Uncharacterized protein n=1 Tax=Eumeta variegata TaxID=151549 RepID=A0A4C1WXS6_EUMVA|nr:hypothetical protein EVAR_23611_1 [Eumeta japonica]